MYRTRWIFRIVFFIVAAILLIYMNGKSNDNAMSIAEFKYKTLKKFQADTLNTKRELDSLIDETIKFVDNSSRVKKGTHYLTSLLILAVLTEITFLVIGKNIRSTKDRQDAS
jgi:hypothetical protein